MTLTNAVIKRLRDIAKDKNISLSKWSMKAGLTPSTLYGALSKKKGCPRLSTIKALCDALNIKLDDFFKEDYLLDADPEIDEI